MTIAGSCRGGFASGPSAGRVFLLYRVKLAVPSVNSQFTQSDIVSGSGTNRDTPGDSSPKLCRLQRVVDREARDW